MNPLSIPSIDPLTISLTALPGCAVLALVSGVLRLPHAVLVQGFRRQLRRMEAEVAAWHQSTAQATTPEPPVLRGWDSLEMGDTEGTSAIERGLRE